MLWLEIQVEQYQKMLDEGKNPPYLYMIDSEKQTSASNA